MAERRMFSKKITDSDAFLDMPLSSQCLYFHLSMNADDDGFVNSPKSVMRKIGSKEDDLKLLIAKNFVIPFESGIVVIKHWRINNYLRADRYKETEYQEEKGQLFTKENGVYSLGIPNDNQWYPQDSMGKVSIVKNSLEKEKDNINVIPKEKSKRFVKPTIEQIQKYCDERENDIDAQRFYDHYESKGWMIGKSPMKDWQAAVRTWENIRKKENPIEQEPKREEKIIVSDEEQIKKFQSFINAGFTVEEIKLTDSELYECAKRHGIA